LPYGTLHGYLAIMRGQDLLYNVQPEPRAARFGGVQRLKDLLELLGRNATARITHLELHLRGSGLAAECQGATRGYGVYGVVHQIEQGPV
jgi:hypothetical protein